MSFQHTMMAGFHTQKSYCTLLVMCSWHGNHKRDNITDKLYALRLPTTEEKTYQSSDCWQNTYATLSRQIMTDKMNKIQLALFYKT